jgi:hypothetical protein
MKPGARNDLSRLARHRGFLEGRHRHEYAAIVNWWRQLLRDSYSHDQSEQPEGRHRASRPRGRQSNTRSSQPSQTQYLRLQSASRSPSSGRRLRNRSRGHLHPTQDRQSDYLRLPSKSRSRSRNRG